MDFVNWQHHSCFHFHLSFGHGLSNECFVCFLIEFEKQVVNVY